MFLLVGHPNVGKTTLFNQLTKSNLHTGNFSGVTMEEEAAFIIGTNKLLVDLPGAYSFLSSQLDEQITYQTLIKENYQGIIQVIDATHLKQGLQLTLQLLELKKPLLIILNMKDELAKKGILINERLLSSYLDVAILSLQASKMTKQEIEQFKKLLGNLKVSNYHFNYKEKNYLMPLGKNSPLERFIKITQDTSIQEELYLKRKEQIDYYYMQVVRTKEIKQKNNKLDQFLLNPWWGTISFIIIMFICYQISFGSGFLGIGYLLRRKAEMLYFDKFINFIKECYYLGGVTKQSFFDGLLQEGVFGGIGSVLVFLPQIIILYFLLYLLEGSGYLARVMVATDYLLAKWGLSGASLVPMIFGLGCTVPAVMACRRIENASERQITMLLTPFISCSARLPVYAMIVSVFFVKYQALIILFIYLLGIIVVLLSAKLFRKTLFKSHPSNFMFELPPYRKVPIKAIAKEIKRRVGSFLKKAGSIILVGSILLWVLTYNPNQNLKQSFLGFWANQIAFIFKPLGFGNWQNIIALITGFVAKETIISSFNLLYQLNGDFSLLRMFFSPLDAFCFIIFVSLYLPCLATLATIKQESKKKSDLIIALIYPFVLSYVITFLIKQVVELFF